MSGASAALGMHELFAWYLQAGRIEIGMLGAAQIDRWGNVNTSVIGSYASPTVRLGGSGGGCEIALHAQSTVIVMSRANARLWSTSTSLPLPDIDTRQGLLAQPGQVLGSGRAHAARRLSLRI